MFSMCLRVPNHTFLKNLHLIQSKTSLNHYPEFPSSQLDACENLSVIELASLCFHIV